MTENFQMLGNAALMQRPKVAFLSSRRVAPATVMRCYDWATGMRGGGSAGRLAPPDGGGTPSTTGLCEMRWWRAGGAAKMAAFPVNAARSASGPYHGRAALQADTGRDARQAFSAAEGFLRRAGQIGVRALRTELECAWVIARARASAASFWGSSSSARSVLTMR